MGSEEPEKIRFIFLWSKTNENYEEFHATGILHLHFRAVSAITEFTCALLLNPYVEYVQNKL